MHVDKHAVAFAHDHLDDSTVHVAVLLPPHPSAWAPNKYAFAHHGPLAVAGAYFHSEAKLRERRLRSGFITGCNDRAASLG